MVLGTRVNSSQSALQAYVVLLGVAVRGKPHDDIELGLNGHYLGR